MAAIIVGSCNVDLISYVDRLPQPAETIAGKSFKIGAGGKGANQCVAAAKLGASTLLISKIGKDIFGDFYLKKLKENHVKTDYVFRTSEASTGVAPITVDKKGMNSIVVILGTNLLLTPNEVTLAKDDISGAKVLACQLEIDPKVSIYSLKLARSLGVTTILNPAPACSLSESDLSVADIFCPNEIEAAFYADFPVQSMHSAREAANILRSKGCRTLVITMGSLGCLYFDSRHEDALTDAIVIPATKVENVVDTTGAGDSFIGALLYFLSKIPSHSTGTEAGIQNIVANSNDINSSTTFSPSIEVMTEILKRCCQIASRSVMKEGTQTSFPRCEEDSVKDILNDFPHL